MATVLAFFLTYNAGHVALRLWGLQVGLREGLRVAPCLGAPCLRQGPQYIGQAGAFVAGVALPLATQRLVGHGRMLLGEVLLIVAVGGVLVARLHGRFETWKWSLGLLALSALYSVLR